MVEQPWHADKKGETARPTSFQLIDIWALLFPCEDNLLLLDSPNMVSKQLTKSVGVTPSLDCDCTEVTNVLVISNSASASATCSLGFCTANKPNLVLYPKNFKFTQIIIVVISIFPKADTQQLKEFK